MQLAKWLIFIGIGLLLLGVLVFIFQKVGLPFGKLPGDIVIKKEKWSFYAPIMTSIAVSIILTLIINLIIWFTKR